MPDEDKQNPSRTDKVQLEAQEIAGDYFKKEFRNHTGRPDVIVLEVIGDEADQHEYLITEVKNSTSTDTIRRGIKETLEYLAFLRVNEEYAFGPTPEDYFGSAEPLSRDECGLRAVALEQGIDRHGHRVGEPLDLVGLDASVGTGLVDALEDAAMLGVGRRHFRGDESVANGERHVGERAADVDADSGVGGGGVDGHASVIERDPRIVHALSVSRTYMCQPI